MTETLAGMSPSTTEELLEMPSLAEAAVVVRARSGVRGDGGLRAGRTVGGGARDRTGAGLLGRPAGWR